jgi:hypothetical protein
MLVLVLVLVLVQESARGGSEKKRQVGQTWGDTLKVI